MLKPQKYTSQELLKAFAAKGKTAHKKTQPQKQTVPKHQNHFGNKGQGDAQAQHEEMREAVFFIPAYDREIWLKIGMILKTELSEAGFALWDEWSKTASEKYNTQDQQKTWASFNGHDLKKASLFDLARDNGCDISALKRKYSLSRPTLKEKQEAHDNDGLASASASDNWPVMGEAAFAGLAGEMTELACRNSEADPVAVLITFLTWFGVIAGDTGWLMVGETKHHPRLFASLVGDTSRARKGTSVEPVRRIFKNVEDLLQVASPLAVSPGPLSSGEGLLFAIRDATATDPGVLDKRLLCIEEELAAPLRAAQRKGNTLTAILRSLWDGKTTAPLIKYNKVTVTKPLVSIIGHITREELNMLLESAEIWNGFANRFLWLAVRRNKQVPFPTQMPWHDVKILAKKIAYQLEKLQASRPITLSEQARDFWVIVYPQISQDYSGILGAVTSRAEAQVMRISLIYALLDGSETIEKHHIQSAMAINDYCLQSASLIFGKATSDPNQNKILLALKQGQKTREDIRKLFSGHATKDQLDLWLGALVSSGKVVMNRKKGRGRPIEVYTLAA